MSGTVLTWPKRLLSADDLRRHLNGQGELQLLPRTIITPLAADELRARGVRVTWQSAGMPEAAPTGWLYAEETPSGMVASAVRSLERDGINLTIADKMSVRALAQAIRAMHPGGILFCGDPATACCIANKLAGIRAAAVVNAIQVRQAQKNLGANLFAIEMPGRTLFELRNLLKTIVAGGPQCPDTLAKTLQELDGHAHR